MPLELKTVRVRADLIGDRSSGIISRDRQYVKWDGQAMTEYSFSLYIPEQCKAFGFRIFDDDADIYIGYLEFSKPVTLPADTVLNISDNRKSVSPLDEVVDENNERVELKWHYHF